jgi:hypothetical protein
MRNGVRKLSGPLGEVCRAIGVSIDSDAHQLGEAQPCAADQQQATATPALSRTLRWRSGIFRGRGAFGRGLINVRSIVMLGRITWQREGYNIPNQVPVLEKHRKTSVVAESSGLAENTPTSLVPSYVRFLLYLLATPRVARFPENRVPYCRPAIQKPVKRQKS